MEGYGMKNKNFFEGTVTDYSAAGMTGDFWNDN